jgi:hypothetical protein
MRIVLVASGVLLVFLGVWLLAAELLRAPSRFVWSSEQAQAAAKPAGAGYIGLIRGDVWLGDALASWEGFVAKADGGPPDAEKLAAVRAALVHAVHLAPHDARAWLILAAADARAGASPDAIAAALKMSYYTGSNEAALIALRISLAARPDLGDAELRILLENEIRTVAQQTQVRPSLAQAYRHAPPETQRSLRDIVTAIDAKLSAEMQSEAAKR